VGLADALVARPPILVLDEPTAGLDPNQIRQVRELVRELGREHTVILSTHILSEVAACATRVLLIHRGKLVAEGPTAAIGAMRAGQSVVITVSGDPALAEAALRGVDGIEDVASVARPDGDPGAARLVATLASGLSDPGAAVERCVAALVNRGIGVREVRPGGGSLEDVFTALTAGSPDAPPTGHAS
jgi:ABC-2 type transport system ATP-binding protein